MLKWIVGTLVVIALIIACQKTVVVVGDPAIDENAGLEIDLERNNPPNSNNTAVE